MNAKTIVFLFAVIACAFSYVMAMEAEPAARSVMPPARCRQNLVRGPCRAFNPRYGYDMEKEACVKFTYGGCQGNSNSFPSLKECQKACEFVRM